MSDKLFKYRDLTPDLLRIWLLEYKYQKNVLLIVSQMICFKEYIAPSRQIKITQGTKKTRRTRARKRKIYYICLHVVSLISVTIFISKNYLAFQGYLNIHHPQNILRAIINIENTVENLI